jgi:hypothetical protein
VETEGEQRINNSYQSLYKQMVDILRTLGIEPVPTVGTPFDPEFHEAIMREPDDSVSKIIGWDKPVCVWVWCGVVGGGKRKGNKRA